MSVFVKGGGALAHTDFKDGVNVAYESSAQTGSVTVTADKSCYIRIAFTRSNRNTTDTITWTIKKNGSTVETFTASTGRMAVDTRSMKLTAGDVVVVSANSSTGYAGARCFIFAAGKDAIS